MTQTLKAPPRPHGRARDMLLQKQPHVERTSADLWERSLPRRRSIARPWEGGHSLAWLAWVGGGLLTIGQIDNPLYIGLIWGCAILVWAACADDGPMARAFHLLMRLGVLIFLLNLIFSVITASTLRGRTVLLTLPTWQLPPLLGGLQLGGVISLEQLIAGASRGFKLWTLVLLIGSFNASVNHYRLLRRVPRFLVHAGLIVTIGLAFVPQTVLRLRAIRDAQRLRGHRFRTWRDALPLAVPLISSGLERALTLAEAMEARGYGHLTVQPPTSRWRWTLLGGVGLLIPGSVGLLFFKADRWQMWLGGLCLISAGLLISGSWWYIGRHIQRTTYLRERWTAGACIVAGAALGLPLLIWLLGRGGSSLGYRIYPQLSAPVFDLRIAGCLLVLALPALLLAQPPNQTGR